MLCGKELDAHHPAGEVFLCACLPEHCGASQEPSGRYGSEWADFRMVEADHALCANIEFYTILKRDCHF
jgi:hypothetical protein